MTPFEAFHRFLIYFTLLCVILRRAEVAATGTAAPCVTPYSEVPATLGNALPEFAMQLGYRRLMMGQTTYCDHVADTLADVIDDVPYIQVVLDTIAPQFFLCEPVSNPNNPLSKYSDGVYNGSLRRVSLTNAVLTGDAGRLKETLRHELFHALCHAYQITKANTDTVSRQPFFTAQGQQKLEKILANGADKAMQFLKTGVNPQLKSSLDTLATSLDEASNDYQEYRLTLQVLPEDDRSMPYYQIKIAASQLYNLIKNNGRLVNYADSDVLAEKIAYILGEVPYPAVKFFMPDLAKYIVTMTDIVRKNTDKVVMGYTPVGSSYQCNHYKYDVLQAWFNRQSWQESEFSILFSYFDATYHAKDHVLRNAAKNGLQTLLGKGLLADEKYLFYKADAYLYNARFAIQDNEWDAAERFYKQAKKAGAIFNEQDKADYAQSLENNGLLKAAAKMRK